MRSPFRQARGRVANKEGCHVEKAKETHQRRRGGRAAAAAAASPVDESGRRGGRATAGRELSQESSGENARDREGRS